MIKKYEEYNESISTLTTLTIVFRLIVIYTSYITQFKGSKIDSKYTDEITKICGFKPADIYLLNSDRLACATINKIYYSKNLEKYLSHREVISVLLHEASHINNLDSLKIQILRIFPYIPVLILDTWLAYLLLPFVSGIFIRLPYERYREYSADSYAHKFGYGEDLASALAKIEYHYSPPKKAKNKDLSILGNILSKLIPLLSSHPKTAKRISNVYKGNPEEFMKNIKIEYEAENPSVSDLKKMISTKKNLN